MGKDALVQQLSAHTTTGPQAGKTQARSPASAAAPARMTQELYPYDRLFSPIKINKLTIKNRIIMAPMGNIDMCEETGPPQRT